MPDEVWCAILAVQSRGDVVSARSSVPPPQMLHSFVRCSAVEYCYCGTPGDLLGCHSVRAICAHSLLSSWFRFTTIVPVMSLRWLHISEQRYVPQSVLQQTSRQQSRFSQQGVQLSTPNCPSVEHDLAQHADPMPRVSAHCFLEPL